MQTPSVMSVARSAIGAIAEIKEAIAAFDHGESNAFDVLDAIVVAIEAHQAVERADRRAA